MRTLISYFFLAFFTGVIGLWSYSLPSVAESKALQEISQARATGTPLAGLTP